jgi:hypothetical protein
VAERDPEVLLEKARLKNMNAEWPEAYRLASIAIDCEPTAVTHMTLLQVRSISLYEMGLYQQCLKDLEKIETFSRLYPKAITAFYGKVLGCKTLILEGEGATAQKLRRECWTSLRPDDQAKYDKLMVLLRLEADLARIWGHDPSPFIHGHSLMAEKIGNELYKGLAILEMFFCRGAIAHPQPFSSHGFDEVRRKLERAEAHLPRIKRMRHEILSDEPWISTSSKVLRNYYLSLSGPAESNERKLEATRFFDSDRELRTVVFLRSMIALSLASFEFQSFENSKVTQKILGCLSSGACAREDVFLALYGRIKFVPHLHNGTIDSSLSRVRNNLGLSLQARDNMIFLKDCLMVDL